jgi:predicted anti-sigma-YlaC factor YlaD
VPGGWRTGHATVGCEQAREAISAGLDSEGSPVAGPALAAHLTGCRSCRDFEASAADIGRRARLHTARDVPEDLVARLSPLLRPAPRPLAALAGLRGRGGRPARLSSARWAASLLPGALAVAALSLGVGAHPHLVPTRPRSPCTIGLIAHPSPDLQLSPKVP